MTDNDISASAALYIKHIILSILASITNMTEYSVPGDWFLSKLFVCIIH